MIRFVCDVEGCDASEDAGQGEGLHETPDGWLAVVFPGAGSIEDDMQIYPRPRPSPRDRHLLQLMIPVRRLVCPAHDLPKFKHVE